ncbi:hypothetical protein BDV09DRAFT_161632 [Aspergillus tetrazonus]
MVTSFLLLPRTPAQYIIRWIDIYPESVLYHVKPPRHLRLSAGRMRIIKGKKKRVLFGAFLIIGFHSSRSRLIWERHRQ